ncbi:VOC family protein [Altererythrobacter confluentis]|uniref:VOC family protein n=1 Tax=Allopontixanthobacter confluentis TaxID=1849021 RepID=A0A6L7GIN8_9SPHN|nr:VOC family protein [Allopontixanthobacter confluentis]MXP15789.1 VOC family protein [Allopontixanthobacter confluentis]
MFSHVMLGADDIDAAKKFYDATFTALGGKEGIVDPKGRLVYMHNGGIFLVTKPIDGQPASCANGSTIGFAAANPAQADAWHKAGLEAGGTAIEDAPGVRDPEGMNLYLAYLRDPAGNKICAMHRMGS